MHAASVLLQLLTSARGVFLSMFPFLYVVTQLAMRLLLKANYIKCSKYVVADFFFLEAALGYGVNDNILLYVRRPT